MQITIIFRIQIAVPVASCRLIYCTETWNDFHRYISVIRTRCGNGNGLRERIRNSGNQALDRNAFSKSVAGLRKEAGVRRLKTHAPLLHILHNPDQKSEERKHVINDMLLVLLHQPSVIQQKNTSVSLTVGVNWLVHGVMELQTVSTTRMNTLIVVSYFLLSVIHYCCQEKA